MGKIYKMNDGESLTIVIDKGEKALKIFREGDKLKITNIENFKKDDNVLVIELDEQKFNHYKFMDSIYDILLKLTNKNMEDRERLNNYMNALVKDLFGKKYTDEYVEIKDLRYFAIAKFDYYKPHKNPIVKEKEIIIKKEEYYEKSNYD